MKFEHYESQEETQQPQHKDSLLASFDKNEKAQQFLSDVDKKINTKDTLPESNDTIAQSRDLLNSLLAEIKEGKPQEIREKIEKSQEHYSDSSSRAYLAMNYNNVSQVLGTGDGSTLFTYHVAPPEYAQSIMDYYNNPPKDEIYPPTQEEKTNNNRRNQDIPIGYSGYKVPGEEARYT